MGKGDSGGGSAHSNEFHVVVLRKKKNKAAKKKAEKSSATVSEPPVIVEKVTPMSAYETEKTSRFMFAHNPIKKRKDPRINERPSPPWVYCPDEVDDKTIDFQFHPDVYKTADCRKGEFCGKKDVCPFRHPGEKLYVPHWRCTGSLQGGMWTPPRPITSDWFKFLMLHFKTKGPCTTRAENHDWKRCHLYHPHLNPTDRRLPLSIERETMEWAARPTKGQQWCQMVHPDLFKRRPCPFVSGETKSKCLNGRYCVYSHGSEEDTLVTQYLDKLWVELAGADAEVHKRPAPAPSPPIAITSPPPTDNPTRKSSTTSSGNGSTSSGTNSNSNSGEKKDKKGSVPSCWEEMLSDDHSPIIPTTAIKSAPNTKTPENTTASTEVVGGPRRQSSLPGPSVAPGGPTNTTISASRSASGIIGSKSGAKVNPEAIKLFWDDDPPLESEDGLGEQLAARVAETTLEEPNGTSGAVATGPPTFTHTQAPMMDVASMQQWYLDQLMSHLAPSKLAATGPPSNPHMGPHTGSMPNMGMPGYMQGGMPPGMSMPPMPHMAISQSVPNSMNTLGNMGAYPGPMGGHAVGTPPGWGGDMFWAMQSAALDPALRAKAAAWSAEDVHAWARGHMDSAVGEVASTLAANDVDGLLLLGLQDTDLRDMGIASYGKRTKLLAAIRQWATSL